MMTRMLMNHTSGSESQERSQGPELKRNFHTIHLFRVSSSDTFMVVSSAAVGRAKQMPLP